jgi:hypothetical protein
MESYSSYCMTITSITCPILGYVNFIAPENIVYENNPKLMEKWKKNRWEDSILD